MAALFSSFSRLFGGADATPRYKTVPIYDDLRSQALSLSAELAGAHKEDEVFGVLMETGYPKAVATLVSARDGAASLYFSSGGGTIGAGGPDPLPWRASAGGVEVKRRNDRRAFGWGYSTAKSATRSRPKVATKLTFLHVSKLRQSCVPS